MITIFLKSFLSSQKISTFLLWTLFFFLLWTLLCSSLQVKISEYLLIVYVILSLKWAFTFFIYLMTFFLQLWMSSLGFSEINCLFYCKTSKVACCWLKEVLIMYKVTEKAACGKEQFDDADRKGVCVKKQIP